MGTFAIVPKLIEPLHSLTVVLIKIVFFVGCICLYQRLCPIHYNKVVYYVCCPCASRPSSWAHEPPQHVSLCFVPAEDITLYTLNDASPTSPSNHFYKLYTVKFAGPLHRMSSLHRNINSVIFLFTDMAR